MKHTLAALLIVACTAVMAAQKKDTKKAALPEKPKDPAAAINTPRPDGRKVTFETTEATWASVDVTPDGRTLVFDMLGDIYTMPIEGSGGSPATRLTSGPAFDMQPRFSPDGRRIAICSDRDGLWNIWTIDIDGTDARQVSRERRWFVNSPAWSPDGAYIYARRHSRRRSRTCAVRRRSAPSRSRATTSSGATCGR
jgi:WD40 repeat protein